MSARSGLLKFPVPFPSTSSTPTKNLECRRCQRLAGIPLYNSLIPPPLYVCRPNFVDCRHTHHAEQKCTQPQEITPLHGAFVKNLYFAFCSGVPTRFRYYRAGHQRTCITFGNALSDLNLASSRSNSPRKKHCSSNAGDPKPPCGLTMGISSLKSRSSGGICPTTSRTCVRAVRCFREGTNSIWRSMRGGSCERGSRRRNRRRRWSRRGWRLWGV